MTISFFTHRTQLGEELYCLVNNFLTSKRIELKKIVLGSQFDMMKACLEDDIIIFDASIEGNCENYLAATAQPSAMDHVLVVSRTKLPLNFGGMREGGSPLKFSTNETIKTNESILDWLIIQINELVAKGERKQKIKLPNTIAELGTYADEINKVNMEIMKDSFIVDDIRKKKQYNIFISYLSKYSECYYDKTILGEKVEKLVKLKKSEGKNVIFFPPGTLSSEFMSEQRRWQVLSIIDRYIRTCKEFWIFETPDYYDSWWTIGELAILSYIKKDNPDNLPELYIYNPNTEGNNRIRKVGNDYIQDMSDEEHIEMARFYSNSDPSTMGVESIRNMRKLRYFPDFLRRLKYAMVQSLSTQVMGDSDMLSDMSYESYKASIFSHAYDLSFWNDRIITCSEFQSPNTLKNKYDFNEFLTTKGECYYRIADDKINKIILQGYWICKRKDQLIKYEIVKETNSNYMWWPIRMGRRTGPKGMLIEELPIYSIRKGK
jgi:hypothetical protein